MNFRKILMIAAFTIVIGMSSTLVLAYYNGSKVVSEPRVQWVSHTEYWSSDGAGITDKASTIVRLTDYRGNPYNVNSCDTSIFYPNKTVYVNNESMTRSSIQGNWYHSAPVPSQEGTYEQEVICYYGTNGLIKTSESFHVNPALNFLKDIDADTLAVGTNLTNVNLDLIAEIAGATASINSNVNMTETSLDALIDSVNSSLSAHLIDVQADLGSNLNDVNVTILAKIAGTNQTISTQLSTTETNLNTLINQVKNDLSTQLTNANVDIDARLSNVNSTVLAKVDDAVVTLTAEIDSTETSLTNLVNTVSSTLSNQLAQHDLDSSTQLTNVEASLIADVGDAEGAILSQINSVNASVSELVDLLNDQTYNYMTSRFDIVDTSLGNIYTDTQWLTSNAMNQDNAAAIDQRFEAVDGNISLIEGFCGNAATNSSELCQEIDEIKVVLDLTRAEQTQYYTTLDQTTTNIWDLLSGDVNTNINTILTDVGVIRLQTTEINETLSDIREEQLSEVNAIIIS